MKSKISHVIFDFDNTLYYNPTNTFEGEIEREKIVKPIDMPFFNYNNVCLLLTGRHVRQSSMILNALISKGYEFDYHKFCTFTYEQYHSINFFNQYYRWKIQEIK